MPETGHNTISEMMQGYAAEAVRLASEHDAELDYSESSLQDVEAILAKMYSNLEKANLGTASPREGATHQNLDSASRIWGAYFGETIRRLWGGEWGVETYPGSVAPVISIDIGGAKMFPVMKVYRRLSQVDADNVWEFYQMVRKKIASGQRQ
jgi:hypothetical protein